MAVSRVHCVTGLLLAICAQACWGQSPMMFSGQPPLGGSPSYLPPFGGGMFSNPLMAMAMSGLDLNKLMYMSMMMNGLGGGGGGGLGSLLPAFGFMNAIN